MPETDLGCLTIFDDDELRAIKQEARADRDSGVVDVIDRELRRRAEAKRRVQEATS